MLLQFNRVIPVCTYSTIVVLVSGIIYKSSCPVSPRFINSQNPEHLHDPVPPTHYHMNLCTLPGSLAHSNSFPKNTTHVPTFTARNHTVSPHNLALSTLNPANEPRLGCTCSRHSTHGRMKYRGSTRGAVISDSVVARSQMSANDVFVSAARCLPPSRTAERCSFPRRDVSCELIVVPKETGSCLQSARSTNQPQRT